MKKRLLLLPVLFSGMTLLFNSCADVDNMSDENAIAEFKITAYSPREIELKTELRNEENKIYIDVTYGADKFPLHFKANVTFGTSIDQILGVDFNDELVLESVDDQITFTIVAVSGMPRKYTIVAREIPYVAPEEIPVTANAIAPQGAILYKNARIVNEVMSLYVVNAGFPMVIYPEFHPGEGITVVGFENGVTPLSFRDVSTTCSLVLADSDGTKRDITVRVEPIRLTNGKTGGGESLEFTIPDVTPAISRNSVQEGLELIGYNIDQVNDTIRLIVLKDPDRGEIEFPLSVDVDLASFGPNVGYMGIDFPLTVTFGSLDDRTNTFLGFDLSGRVARYWTFALEDYASMLITEANITSFQYDYDPVNVGWLSTKYAITLDKSVVQIDPGRAEIHLKMTGYNAKDLLASNAWSLTLKNVVIEVSEGATYEIIDAFSYAGWQETKQIRVNPKYGQERIWTLIIKDFRSYTASDKCDIESVSINGITPVMAATDPAGAVEIDAEAGRVSINLSQDEGCYPMTIKLDYLTSPYSILSSATGNPRELVFDLIADHDTGIIVTNSHTVTVTAENGATRDWTIALNRPVLTSETKITGFSVTSMSSSRFAISDIVIDDQAGEVLIYLNQGGGCPLTINYVMSLSRNARLSDGIEAAGSYTFTSLAKPWIFRIIGREGNVQEWRVKFADWTPQVQNAGLESWSGNNPTPKGTSSAPYWATSNNSFKTDLVVQGAGNGGGSAAKLETKSAPLVSIAAGSVFLGWFDADNSMSYGTSDPVRLTFQGIEFAATKKIVALDIDINYTSVDGDTGSVAIEILKHDPKKGSYIYHGKRPSGALHPDNTAYVTGSGRRIIGNTAKAGVTNVLPSGQWQTVRINIDYGSYDPLEYSHIVVICSSSSEGDLFKGGIGTVMLVDNVKLVYEGDQ